MRRNLCCIILCMLCLALYGEDYPAGMEAYVKPISDPLEGFNRCVQGFNGGMNEYVVYPFASLYTYALPKPVRNGVGNFFSNLGYPLRLVNTCIQGKFGDAWDETKRFGINTTVGILGFRDQAGSWGIPAHKEDFGQTFAHYGMGPGCFLNIPLMGPTTARDLLGDIAGIPFNLVSWICPGEEGMVINGTGMLTRVLDNSASIKQFFATEYDTYAMTRAATVLSREAAINDYKFDAVKPDPDQALGFMLLKPVNERFVEYAHTHKIKLPGALNKIPYSCWKPAKKCKNWQPRTMVILPGLGGHRLSTGIAALAELYSNDGWNVIALSSTMHSDFFLGMSQTRFPGDLLADSKDLDAAIGLALADFNRRYPKYAAESCSVFGFSLGAINALYLASQSNSFKCDRFIVINPPRRPYEALAVIDRYMAIPGQWDPSLREQRTRALFHRLAGTLENMTGGGDGSSMLSIPLTREESQFLIGIALSFPLSDAVAAMSVELGHSIPGMSETPSLGDTLGLRWLGYVERAVLPEVNGRSGRKMTSKELGDSFSIDVISEKIRKDSRIYLLHNANDFLVTSGDLEWYQGLFGQRAIILAQGSHLGNIYRSDYQELLLKVSNGGQAAENK